MKTTIVLTAIGKDRPGIVSAVSKVLYETGCNIEDSSMTILKGDFAMILAISLPEGLNATELDKKLDPVKQLLNLLILLRELPPEELIHKPPSDTQMYIISVYGTDKPGIVYKVTKILADAGVNICDVNTKITGNKKNPVYVMVLEVEIPPQVKIDDITEKLSSIGKELKVEINIKPLETLEL